MKAASRNNWVLLILVVLKFVLQYHLIHPVYELHRDEFLHLDLGHHPAWGYLSVPPFTALISKLIYLLGSSVFWVKFFPALFGALTVVVVWRSIRELKGKLFALILGATGILFSVLLRINTLYQPNSFDILCWTTFYLVLIKYFNSEKPKWLYLAAVIFALGFLNKYNIAFLLLGLFPALLLTKHRKLFLQNNLYLSMLLGLVIVLPNLLWQYNNDFPVVHHMQELAKTQLVNIDRTDFLKSQMLFFIGSSFVIIAALYAFWVYGPFRRYRVFFWSFFFTLAVFTMLKAKDYYAIGLYPVYIAFGSVYLEQILQADWKKYLRPVAVTIPILLFIPMYSLIFPNKTPEYIISHSDRYKKAGLLRWEDGKDHAIPQDFADMLGWKELARQVDSIYRSLPYSEHTLVFCDNYGQAGAINFYSSEGVKAVSFNADYMNWIDLDRRYTNLIRVKTYEKQVEEDEEAAYFESSAIAGSIKNPYAREYKTRIVVYKDAKIDISKKIKGDLWKKRRL